MIAEVEAEQKEVVAAENGNAARLSRLRGIGLTFATVLDNPADAILLPKLGKLLRKYPDIKVEIVIDYGLTDIVAQRFDAGVRSGEQVASGRIAVRIAPDMPMAVVGSPRHFKDRPEPKQPRDLIDHNCICLRLPTHGGLYAWEFEKGGRLYKLKVRVDGQLIFNTTAQMLNAAIAWVGLAYVPEGMAHPYLARGRIKRGPEDWCLPYPGYYIWYPKTAAALCGLRPVDRCTPTPRRVFYCGTDRSP